ncbi:phosphotransferase [Bacillus lacus]|uniref:Phosphotransferase n=1 Tax=Metabacillus lacus TaxID=1983721 RepID=A0A7X2IYY3_9BACI|nr:phosphotransferase family protein [Metabacillus lacus]MRX72236.1 phosphotransferase [Metabacillus lacus]
MSATIPVRKGEELRKEKLFQYLSEQIRDFPQEPLEITQFGTGASNLTYALKAGNWEAVLRRPPLGPLAPKAHDMKREYEVLNALHPLFPLAPKPLTYCGDKTVLGSSFFLMERKEGILVDTELPEWTENKEEAGKRISALMADTLAELHKVPYEQTGLTEISKPNGFMERQVTGWIERYQRAKTDDIAEADILMKWLAERIPDTQYISVIHYDFKLNNALFSRDLYELSGLFDWEMATVGDSLADLGAAMSYWMEPDDPLPLKLGLGKPSVTASGMFYSRKEFMERYALKSGKDLTHIHYYLTFAYFKLSVICQQIYYRYKKGQTADQRFADFGKYTEILIQHALAQTGK